MSRRLIVLSCLASACVSALAESNLLNNPGFASDLSGWANPFDRPAAWDLDDAMLSSDSGSALLGHADISNGAYSTVLSQCIPVNVPGDYMFGAWMRNLPDQPLLGSGIIFLRQYFDAACTIFATSQNTGIATGTQWELRESFALILADTQSVRIDLSVGKPSGETALHQVLFDAAFFEPYDPIFADGFDPGER